MTATAGTTYYRPGLIFKAKDKAFAHQEICFSGAPEIRNTDGSLQREAIRMLVAEFGVYGDEYSYENIDGQLDYAADIRGGFFDLDAQAADKGWDDREKELVARHMVRLAENGRGQFSLYSKPKVGAPWPTYDQAHHSKVVELATTLGLISESLLYEEQKEKPRPSVVEGLREALKKAQEPAVDELVAE